MCGLNVTGTIFHNHLWKIIIFIMFTLKKLKVKVGKKKEKIHLRALTRQFHNALDAVAVTCQVLMAFFLCPAVAMQLQ